MSDGSNYGRELPAEAAVITRLRGRDRDEIQEEPSNNAASTVASAAPQPTVRWGSKQFAFYWNGEMYAASYGEIRKEMPVTLYAPSLGSPNFSPTRWSAEEANTYEVLLSTPDQSLLFPSSYKGGTLVVPFGYGGGSMSGVAMVMSVSGSESTTDVVFRLSGKTAIPTVSLYGVMTLCGEKYPIGEPKLSQGPSGVITTVPVLVADVPEIGRAAYGPIDIHDQSELVLRGYASAVAWKPSPCRTHVECSMSTKLIQYDVRMTASEKGGRKKSWISELLGDGVASRVASRAARAYLDTQLGDVQVRGQRSVYETAEATESAIAQDIKRARG